MADRRPPKARAHPDEKAAGAPRKEPRDAPVSANKAIPPSRVNRAAKVADDPIPDAQADLRDLRRDALAGPAETAAAAREATAARRPGHDPGAPRDADEAAVTEPDEAEPAPARDASTGEAPAQDTDAAHRDRVRRNHEIPLSLGPASVHDEPFRPVGTGEDPARDPRLFDPEEPDVQRTSDPTRATPFLETDDPELADNPRETMAARELADGPEHGSDSPGHQQDQ